MIEAMLNKLRCFGVPKDGIEEVFCANSSIDDNSSIPTSVLNKGHNNIFYRRLREAQSAGVILVGCITKGFNLTD